jgi:hypothetical protein
MHHINLNHQQENHSHRGIGIRYVRCIRLLFCPLWKQVCIDAVLRDIHRKHAPFSLFL